MIRQLVLFTLVLCVSVCAWAADHETITIKRTDGTSVDVSVELATDDNARAYGLMFREELPQGQGMLFVYPHPARRAFWMKDTLIPLDMLFFTADGQLVHIEAEATPRDLSARGPDRADICAVLEIGGGEAARQGLKTGDHLVLTDSSACLPYAR